MSDFALHDLPGLELPDGSGFESRLPACDPEAVLTMCELYLPRILGRPGHRERVGAERCPAEFDLQHPDRVPPTYPAALIGSLLQGKQGTEEPYDKLRRATAAE